jgi:hypothetical protein
VGVFWGEDRERSEYTLARVQGIKVKNMVRIYQRISYEAVHSFAESTCHLWAVTLSGVCGLASRLFSRVHPPESPLDTFELDYDDATFTRLDQLLANDEFLSFISQDDFSEYVAIWGSLYSQKQCNSFLANNGI